VDHPGWIRDPSQSPEAEILADATAALLAAHTISYLTPLNTGHDVDDLDFAALKKCKVALVTPGFIRQGTKYYDQLKLLADMHIRLVTPYVFNGRPEIPILLLENGGDYAFNILPWYQKIALPTVPREEVGPAFLYLMTANDGKPLYKLPKGLEADADILMRGDPSKMTLDEWNTAISTSRYVFTDDPIFATLFAGYNEHQDVLLLGHGWNNLSWVTGCRGIPSSWVEVLKATARQLRSGKPPAKIRQYQPTECKITYFTSSTFVGTGGTGGTLTTGGNGGFTYYYT
jgi:hypothetical protein